MEALLTGLVERSENDMRPASRFRGRSACLFVGISPASGRSLDTHQWKHTFQAYRYGQSARAVCLCTNLNEQTRT